MKKNTEKKKKASILLRLSMRLSIIVIIFLTFALLLDWFEIVRLKAFDYLYFRLRPEISIQEDIVIVVIDDMSIKEFGEWPWSRDRHARLIDFLSRAGAKVVGFDIIFPDKSPNPANDASLVDATRKAGNVYYAISVSSYRRRRAQTEKVSIVVVTDKEREMDELLLNYCLPSGQENVSHGEEDEGEVTVPFSSLTRVSKGLGNITYDPDIDGAIRNSRLIVDYKGRKYPSLSLCLVAGYKDIDLKTLQINRPLKLADLAVPIDRRGGLMVNYAGEFWKFKIFPYYRVLQGEIPEREFKDKIVLVGSTATGAHDLRVTSFSGNFPGIGVHANVVNSILQQKYIVPLPLYISLVLIIAFGLLMGYTLPRLKALSMGIFTASILLGLFFIGFFLFLSGFYLDIVYPSAAVIFSYLPISLYGFVSEAQRKREIIAVFGRYVTPVVVEELLKDPGKLSLGGVRKNVTVLYADVRGFTTISERLQPEEVVSFLNELFEEMSEAIFEFGGTLDKFIGDAILAIFGAPISHEDDALRAVKAAWEMHRRIDELNKRRTGEDRPEIKMGIGINTGDIVVGNIGSHIRMDYTVIGDGVNIAQRIEDLARQGEIFISDTTYDLVKDVVDVEKFEPVKVKGKENLVQIYKLNGIKE